jgi:hypothetical protein
MSSLNIWKKSAGLDDRVVTATCGEYRDQQVKNQGGKERKCRH